MDRHLPTIEERYAAEPADAVANLQEAWMAIKAIRAALEQFRPVREPEDPDFTGEAKVLVEADLARGVIEKVHALTNVRPLRQSYRPRGTTAP